MDGTRVEEFEPPVIIRVARTLEDMQRIAVVRALVYMAEQDCPYDEEFDGNDLAGATHLLGEAGGEPFEGRRLSVSARVRCSQIGNRMLRGKWAGGQRTRGGRREGFIG